MVIIEKKCDVVLTSEMNEITTLSSNFSRKKLASNFEIKIA